MTNYLSFRFEENHGFVKGAREVYDRAYQFFGEDYMDEEFYIAFAKFEERHKEVGNKLVNGFLLAYFQHSHLFLFL